MAIVNKPNTFSGNTTISSSEVNSNFDTLYNEFNGSISAANLADDAVTAAKLADNAVVAANISSDSVTATKIDWASTGTDGGIWWEELGRTTLSGAGDTISVASLPARKYLKLHAKWSNTGGTVSAQIRFNNDSGNNYAFRYTSDAIDGAVTSAALIGSFGGETGSLEGYVSNTATLIKTGKGSAVSGSTSAATSNDYAEIWFKWVNTTDSINRIDLVNTGTGDFAIGSEVVVLGHN